MQCDPFRRASGMAPCFLFSCSLAALTPCAEADATTGSRFSARACPCLAFAVLLGGPSTEPAHDLGKTRRPRPPRFSGGRPRTHVQSASPAGFCYSLSGLCLRRLIGAPPPPPPLPQDRGLRELGAAAPLGAARELLLGRLGPQQEAGHVPGLGQSSRPRGPSGGSACSSGSSWPRLAGGGGPTSRR